MNWQPIETAPKVDEGDGWPILVYCPERRFESFHLATYDERRERWRIFIDGQTIYPSHWMPLPPPPVE
jgi:hypothetical protein